MNDIETKIKKLTFKEGELVKIRNILYNEDIHKNRILGLELANEISNIRKEIYELRKLDFYNKKYNFSKK